MPGSPTGVYTGYQTPSSPLFHFKKAKKTDIAPPADKSAAVIGIMLEVTPDQAPSPFFTSALSGVSDAPNAGDTAVTGPLTSKDLTALVRDSEVYHYDGSLTTPPCTEGVKWSVVRDPAYVSVKTFAGAKGAMGFNARYTQNEPGERNLLDQAGGEE